MEKAQKGYLNKAKIKLVSQSDVFFFFFSEPAVGRLVRVEYADVQLLRNGQAHCLIRQRNEEWRVESGIIKGEGLLCLC